MRGEGAIVTRGAGGMARAGYERRARHGAQDTATDLKAPGAQRITEAIRTVDDQTAAADAPGIRLDPNTA